MEKLRYYQIEAAKEIYDKKRVLIADAMGLGKTAEAIAAKRVIDMKDGYQGGTLVVCPGSVKEHWKEEIEMWYQKKDGSSVRVALVDTANFDQDITNAAGADFVLLAYSTLSYLGNKNDKIKAIMNLGFQYGILDEAHNAKNPESIRGQATRNIFQVVPYLAILSGTPIPNTIVDIYTLLNLLDKEQFPLHSENSKSILNSFYNLFRDDPELVSRVINNHRIRRTAEDYLGLSFPTLNKSDLEVMLSGDHREAYLQIYENNSISPNLKLMYLVEASIDPNLIPSNLLPKDLVTKRGAMESCVYQAIDDLVESVINRNGKVLIFSDLKEGVVKKLAERYSQYGALVIDGDVSPDSRPNQISKREEIRRQFQQDPEHKILITTTVMDEGVDLTAATDVIHLTLPYTPAAFDQRNRRAQRIGEVKKDQVNVHVIMPKLGIVPVITEGIENLLNDKRRIIEYIEKDPLSLTRQDLEEITNGHNYESRCLAPALNPMRTIMSHLHQIKGKGYKKIQQHYADHSEEAEYLAKLYASNWEGFYGGNTAEVYAQIIKILESKIILPRKLDLASGPFSLSRKIIEPVTNVDINPFMLEAGKLLEKKDEIIVGNTAFCAPFHQLPLQSESIDFALCSLALHYSTPLLVSEGNQLHEREQVIREMNRVLRNEGYGIITLPNSVIDESDFERFHDSLQHLGFNVMGFSGFYTGKSSKFKVYVAGLQKVRSPDEQLLLPEQMQWKMDLNVEIKVGRSGPRKRFPKRREQPLPKIITDFHNSETGESLEEMIWREFR